MNKLNDIKKKLGERIKFLRQNKKITQEKFAEKIDIEPQSLSNIERGKFAPSFETLLKIANVLEVNLYELYLFEKEDNIELIKNELIDVIKNNDTTAFELYSFYKKSVCIPVYIFQDFSQYFHKVCML